MIIRGTTPPIRFSFEHISPLAMTAAFLTIRQGGVVIEKDLSEAAAVTEKILEWQLTQEETLALEANRQAKVQCRYKLTGDAVGASKIHDVPVSAVLKDGEI